MSDVSVGDASLAGQRFRILRPHARDGLGEVYVVRGEELDGEGARRSFWNRLNGHKMRLKGTSLGPVPSPASTSPRGYRILTAAVGVTSH